MHRSKDTILVRSAGSYVRSPTAPNPDSKKRVKSAPLNFGSPEVWLTAEDAIEAQKVLAGISYNLTRKVDENDVPILDEREVPVAVTLVLEVLGIFQNLDDRHYPYPTTTQPVESRSLGSAVNVTMDLDGTVQERSA